MLEDGIYTYNYRCSYTNEEEFAHTSRVHIFHKSEIENGVADRCEEALVVARIVSPEASVGVNREYSRDQLGR